MEDEDPTACPVCGAPDHSCRPAPEREPMVLTLAEQRWRAANMASIVVTERVYLDADGKATTDEEKGQVLWATPGREVPEAEAERVGYSVPKAKAQGKPKGTKVVEGPEGDK